MKPFYGSLLVVIVFAGYLSAATLVITSAGYWQMTTNAQGVPVLTPFDSIVRMGPETDPPVDPPDDPTSLTQMVRRWATEVNEPKAAEAQGFMVEMIAEQGARGTFASKADMAAFTKVAIPKTLSAANSTKVDSWNVVWDDKIWPEVRRIEGAGQMNELDDQVRVWQEIADGFKSTVQAQWSLEYSTIGGEVSLVIKGEANPFLDILLKLLFQLLLEWLNNRGT